MRKKVKGYQLEKDTGTGSVSSTDKNGLAQRKAMKKQSLIKDKLIQDQGKRISDLEEKLSLLLRKIS